MYLKGVKVIQRSIFDDLHTEENVVKLPTPTKAKIQKPTTKTSFGDDLRRELKGETVKDNQVSIGSNTNVPPHVLVRALAGTGKTTTLVCGLQVLRGLEPTVKVWNVATKSFDLKKIDPSPQQRAIWDAISLSRGQANTVCFAAFNSSIAAELKHRVPFGCDAMTMHSMGFRAVKRVYGKDLEPDRDLYRDMISSITGKSVQELRRNMPLLRSTEELTSLCKMNLVNDPELETLDDLAYHYELSYEDDTQRQQSYRLVQQLLVMSKDVKANGRIHFDDQVWLPLILNLPVYKYDLLLLDEGQDLNRCQQELAKRAGKRIIICGDENQAIYAWAGADSESLSRMANDLSAVSHQFTLNPVSLEVQIQDLFAKQDPVAISPGQLAYNGSTGTGLVTLPLTITRRCGKVIAAEARKIVPDFEAHESNCEGEILTALYPIQFQGSERTERPYEKTYMPMVQSGDFIICRVNAPLVSQCYRFLKMGRKAKVMGRRIGQGLASTIKNLGVETSADLLAKALEWYDKEVEKEGMKKRPSESKLITLRDKYDCIAVFCEDVDTVDQVLGKINDIFTDDEIDVGIRLSSIHRVKGMESKNVFFLRPRGGECPHPMAKSDWQRRQERNLLYVGITRAIERLIFVS